MDKPIRKAVRCYLIKDNKVVVTKYKESNKKAGYYEIPGGKIEEGETPEQTAIREMKEETGLKIRNLKYRGNMTIEYPNRIFDFDVFICNECEGKPQDFEENTSEWIEINELLKKEKLLSNIMILDRFFIKGLIDDRYNLKMNIQVDEKENILDVKYRLEEKENKNRILITGAVLSSDDSMTKIYEKIISLIDTSKYSVSSPLDTMRFDGNDIERYKRAMNLLKDTKLVIAEMSNISTGQEMELQEAVNLNIPILVIAKEGSKISGLAKGCNNVKIIIYYNKIEDIEDKILRFIEENI